MRFITQLGDGKGFYGEDNDRHLAWCNGVKHPKSGRNDLRLEVLADPSFRIWFLWTQGARRSNGLFSSRLNSPVQAQLCHSLANVANFLHPLLLTVWFPHSILFANTHTTHLIPKHNVKLALRSLFHKGLINICRYPPGLGAPRLLLFIGNYFPLEGHILSRQSFAWGWKQAMWRIWWLKGLTNMGSGQVSGKSAPRRLWFFIGNQSLSWRTHLV